LTICRFSPALKEIPNIRSTFPNLSRPGKPKMKFPNFSQIPNPVGTLHVVIPKQGTLKQQWKACGQAFTHTRCKMKVIEIIPFTSL
jgi:hypothetical protein